MHTKGDDCSHFHEINTKLRYGVVTFLKETLQAIFVVFSAAVASVVTYVAGGILLLSFYAIFGKPDPWRMGAPGIPITRTQGVLDIIIVLSIASIIISTWVGGIKYWLGMTKCAVKKFKL